MDIRRIIIYSLIAIFLIILGSKYVIDDEINTTKSHVPQREINMNHNLPAKAAIPSSKIDSFSVKNSEATAKEITALYKDKFENLQAVTNEKIDSLLKKAASEYESAIDRGERLSVKNFYQKYSQKGLALEQQTDENFQSLYEELIQVLKENGYSEEYAKPFQEEYNEAKKQRGAEVVKQAISIISE